MRRHEPMEKRRQGKSPVKAALLVRMLFYNLLMLVLSPLLLAWFSVAFLMTPRRRAGLRQRLGRAPRGTGRVIWVHAVSVGEVKAVQPMLKLLRGHLGPDDRLFLSTVTLTGQETARRECRDADEVFYFPLDFPFSARRALARVKPSLFITAETELWPNFLGLCALAGTPVILVNGRISDRSFGRYRALRWFFSPFLATVRRFLMQSETDAERVIGMGAPLGRVTVTGNTKYDRRSAPGGLPAPVTDWIGDGPLLVAGSTHEGEERLLVETAFSPSLAARDLRLALVPRHPERFDEVARMLEEAGVSFSRYSEVIAGEAARGTVLLVDAMGVLDAFYAAADVAFVGGSLVPVGGHNLLEPAMLGKPVLTGPHLGNFRDIADALLGGHGALVVEDGPSVGEAVERLLADDRFRACMGEAARDISERATGASLRNVAEALSLVGARR